MIAYIKGKVIDRFDGGVVLENNGIGYEIFCSSSAFSRLVEKGEGGVHTYFQVKEDGVALFGFDTKDEKNMFLKLISVSGIGPKIGIGILSGMRVCDLATAIATSDVKTLSKIKGLGKKSAERIILELRESVSAGDIGEVKKAQPIEIPLTRDEEDAIVALMGLGFTGTQAKNAVKFAREQGACSIEQIISFALQSLNR
ncbi:MAG: Holliday junction branch migration protein RuvA [Clostridia bacterium]|nr:Holliday junction branch migration protein RuvA [Clostridia bacterium]